MSDTAEQPKRNYTAIWIAVACVLLVLAAAGPIAVKFFGPREFQLLMHGDSGGTVAWRCDADGTVTTGITNLPVTILVRASRIDFTVQPTNYSGDLGLSVSSEDRGFHRTTIIVTTGGIRFHRTPTGHVISGTP